MNKKICLFLSLVLLVFLSTKYVVDVSHSKQVIKNIGFKVLTALPKEKATRPILIVQPSLSIGGAEKALVSMLNHPDFPKQKVSLCLLSRGGEFERFIPEGVPVVSLQEATKKSYDTVIGYLEYLDTDIIKKISAKQRIMWIHCDVNSIKDPTFPIVNRDKIEGIDTFVCVSQGSADSFIKRFPDLKAKTCVVSNIINAAIIKKEALQPISEIKKEEKSITIVSVGRLDHVKGFDRAVRVCAQLIKEGYPITWYVVGEGNERRSLENLIRQHGVNAHFILLGARVNPYPYMKQADIFAVTSRFEGFSLVITEAKILNLPMVVADFPCAKEQIISGENGLIVTNDEEALCQGLKRLINTPQLREKFANALCGFEFDNSQHIATIQQLIE